MKNLIALLCFAILLSVTSTIFSQSPQERLLGKWQLSSTSGGMTGRGFPIEKKTVIEFTSDCNYKSYEQDTLKYTKTYSFQKSAPKYHRKDSVAILHIGNGFFRKYEFSLYQNKLVLREPYVEGFIRIYRRVLPN